MMIFLILLLQTIVSIAIFIAVMALLYYVAKLLGLIPENVAAQIAAISFCFIMSSLFSILIKMYLVHELGWDWLDVVPRIPPGDNIPQLRFGRFNEFGQYEGF